MRGRLFAMVMTLAVASPVTSPAARAQQGPSQNSREVDRIVVRIESDIILESQVRELAAFQTLIEGHPESDDQLIQELIEQWEVQTEASDAHFPQPAQSEVDRELSRLMAQFASPAAYDERLRQLDLAPVQVRQTLSDQIFVERYLDYKFRPAVEIDSSAIEAYYQNELTPQLRAKDQSVPPLADVQDEIRELLTQKEISTRATQWLDDTKSRLKIEIAPAEPAP